MLVPTESFIILALPQGDRYEKISVVKIRRSPSFPSVYDHWHLYEDLELELKK